MAGYRVRILPWLSPRLRRAPADPRLASPVFWKIAIPTTAGTMLIFGYQYVFDLIQSARRLALRMYHRSVSDSVMLFLPVLRRALTFGCHLQLIEQRSKAE